MIKFVSLCGSMKVLEVVPFNFSTWLIIIFYIFMGPCDLIINTLLQTTQTIQKYETTNNKWTIYTYVFYFLLGQQNTQYPK